MLQKESWLHVCDNTNVRWIKIFQLYKGFHRKQTKPSLFVKGTCRVVEPPRLEYKGFKYKYNIKGDIVRMLIVRSRRRSIKKDSSILYIYPNSGFIVKKKQDPRSRFLNGPVSKALRKKKILTLFKKHL